MRLAAGIYRLLRPRAIALALWALFVFAVVCGTSAYDRKLEADAMTATFARADSAVETFRQVVLRILGETTALQKLLQERDRFARAGQLVSAAAIDQHLRDVVANAGFGVVHAATIGADGMLSWDTTRNWKPVWLGDRDHFVVPASGAPGLFVSRPVLGRASKRWAVQISRALQDAEGGFGGVAVVSIDPIVLAHDLAEQLPGGVGILSIRRSTDGALIARSKARITDWSDASGADHPLVLAAAAAAEGHIRYAARSDGAQLLVSYRRLGEGGLLVSAAFDRADVMGGIAGIRRLVLGIATLLGVGSLIGTELLFANRRLNTRILEQALRDPLTGLHNRRHFEHASAQMLDRVERDGGWAALLLIDLDHFKIINDTLGHGIGDALLCAVAGRLQRCVRDHDTVVRFGGDEFAVLAAGIEQPEVATQLSDRLMASLRASYEIDGQRVEIGASIGVTLIAAGAGTLKRHVQNADLALYKAKTDGRGRICFFDPVLDEDMRTRQALARDLRGALAGGQLEIYYQPFLNLSEATVSGFEALLRWHHPLRGMVPPDLFIPIAENIGLIADIGAWVLRQACAEARNWPEDMRVAINLSPLQFKSAGIAGTVAAALADAGLDGRRLELEITEGVLLDDCADTLGVLQQLRDLGVRLALDDFGTGYASMKYLLRFSFDKIKIDRSFINDVAGGGDGAVIARAMLGVCANLGVDVIAEGVETEQQLRWLIDEGCQEIQGYLLSRPVPAQDLPALTTRLIQQAAAWLAPAAVVAGRRTVGVVG